LLQQREKKEGRKGDEGVGRDGKWER